MLAEPWPMAEMRRIVPLRLLRHDAGTTEDAACLVATNSAARYIAPEVRTMPAMLGRKSSESGSDPERPSASGRPAVRAAVGGGCRDDRCLRGD